MNRSLRVLIVEDSEDDSLLLVRELTRGGYLLQYERVESADQLVASLSHGTWDLVLADYSLPHFKGTDALKLLKERGIDIPFIFVSGSITDEIAVTAMKAGAHDYVMKGNLARLLPAIDRELREADERRERRRAEEQSREKSRRLSAVRDIDLAIMSSLELRDVLDILLDKVDAFLPGSVTTIRLLNRTTGNLERTACRNVDERKWKALGHAGVEGLAKLVVTGRTPITVGNVQTDPRSQASGFARAEGLVSYLGVPLIAKGEILGVIGFYTRTIHFFEKEEIEFLLTLAGQTAIAIHNAKLYEEVKEKMVALEKSNRVKDEFISVLSHEMRTPLNVAMGYAQLVKERVLGDINSDQEKALDKALSHSHQLLKLIDAILSVRTPEGEGMNAQESQVNVGALLDELKARYSNLEKNLSPRWDYSMDLPLVETDGTRLKKILENVIDNAIKFTEKGGVTVSAAHVPRANAVRFQVSDTGIGIPGEKLPVIFEMFQQLDSSDTRSYGGVGLGLFVVKRFTRLLGGEVAVDSKEGNGSTFAITIPVNRLSASDPAPRTRGDETGDTRTERA